MHAQARARIEAINSEWLRRRFHRTLIDDYFHWPSTDAKGGNGGIDPEKWIKNGLLTFMGYQVGVTSSAAQGWRERLLSEIFVCYVPPVFEDQYIREWGRPGSVDRLRKMANALAAFTRNARRRRGACMDTAVKDWGSDLGFLYYEYYVGKFGFAWPTTRI